MNLEVRIQWAMRMAVEGAPNSGTATVTVHQTLSKQGRKPQAALPDPARSWVRAPETQLITAAPGGWR